MTTVYLVGNFAHCIHCGDTFSRFKFGRTDGAIYDRLSNYMVNTGFLVRMIHEVRNADPRLEPYMHRYVEEFRLENPRRKGPHQTKIRHQSEWFKMDPELIAEKIIPMMDKANTAIRNTPAGTFVFPKNPLKEPTR